MSETWYKATSYSIQAITIEKATDKMVVIGTNGRKELIDSSYHHWRKDRDRAISAILSDMELKIERVKSDLRYLQEQRDKFQAHLKEESTTN